MIDLTSKFGRKVKRHLKQEYVVWLTTVGPDLAPQPRPVWFIWDGSSFLIFSQPHAHKVQAHRGPSARGAAFQHRRRPATQDVIVFVGHGGDRRHGAARAQSARLSQKVSSRHGGTGHDAGAIQPRILCCHARDADNAARLVIDRRRARLPAAHPRFIALPAKCEKSLKAGRICPKNLPHELILQNAHRANRRSTRKKNQLFPSENSLISPAVLGLMDAG